MEDFNNTVGGAAYSSDEYQMANSLKESVEAKDFKRLETLTKKPLFSFLETEIVRCLKKFAMNPPAGAAEGFVTGSAAGQGNGKSKKAVLDEMFL